MEMKAAVEAEAKATMKARAVMPGMMAAQAGPAWAKPAQDLTVQARARAAKLLVGCAG
jgi:hypothetical protein